MKLSITCLILLIALIGISCSREGGTKIAFVTNNTAEFWTFARKGCEKADSELNNISVEFKMPADGSAAEQKRIVDDLLAKGVKGIAISPSDPANQTQLIDNAAKQAFVVTQDSDAPNSQRAFYLGTDNVEAGRQAGRLIKEAIPQGGKIMIFVGKLDARNAQERKSGIEEILKDSNITIIGTKTDDVDQTRAKANVSDTLVQYPDVACLVGLWSYNGPAIISAVREANKQGKIKIVCFDEADQTLEGIKDGWIHATVVQQPYEFGYRSVHLIARALSGDRSVIPANKLEIIPTLIIKRNDVDAFIIKMNQLRGRS
ncbi:MAG: sugar-binding protein [Acidobacteria bacterium]|nr:sugar-binding protein [Acidobacteriota bacterium]